MVPERCWVHGSFKHQMPFQAGQMCCVHVSVSSLVSNFFHCTEAKTYCTGRFPPFSHCHAGTDECNANANANPWETVWESTASPPPVWSCPLCWWWHTKPKVRVVLNHTQVLNCTIVDWRDRRSLYFFTNAVRNTYFWLWRSPSGEIAGVKLQVNFKSSSLNTKAPQPVAALVSLGPPPDPWRPRSKLAAVRCCFCCLFFWWTSQNKDAEQRFWKAARHPNPPSTHLSTSPWVEPINSLPPTHKTITLSAQRPLFLKPDTPFCLRWSQQPAESEARSMLLYTGDFFNISSWRIHRFYQRQSGKAAWEPGNVSVSAGRPATAATNKQNNKDARVSERRGDVHVFKCTNTASMHR